MHELALFAGAGGGILGGVLLGWRTVCAVEKEPYCREVLLRRQRDGVLPVFPIWDDVRTFCGRPWRGMVDVVTAGFPCQPFSVAGKQRGEDDERNMWPDTIRVIREVGPRWALLENVPGLLTHDYFGEILGDLADAGYDASWDVISAAEVGAPHIRKRLWIVCHANSGGESTQPVDGEMAELPCDIPDAAGKGLAKREGEPGDDGEERQASVGGRWWDAEPGMGRVANGVANRLVRLRALGNGQVPAVAREAWCRLSTLANC